MRRFGASPAAGGSYVERPGAYAVIRAGRGMLLTEWEDQLHLPGGGIDPGEGALSALHRECREEIGWSIGVERRLGMFHSFTYATDLGAWVHKACQVYLARPALRIGPPSAPGHRAAWMPIDLAIDLLASGDASTFLRSIEGGMARAYAGRWRNASKARRIK